MKIDIKIIKELSKSIEKYGLEEVVLESEGTKISMKREFEKEVLMTTQVVTNQPLAVAPTATKVAKAVEQVSNLDYTKSPMVGTYYGSPSPDADLFVNEGQIVEVGDTLCIVEAMKLMNEVKAEKRCKIGKILLKDGDPVTKGADLFLIEEV
ncbi:MAG: acetyl-CoA carboxylase biotin carboxyl carrier protein [Psychrilyobacter sp.]|nr:acetyl-CoA carboxylase biotin carboxyl carrier protein [Psychrilyobacter sp.]